jgi:hypothetical protein
MVAGGEVVTDALGQIGTHRIRAGRQSRTVDVRNAQLSPYCVPLVIGGDAGTWAVPVPHGDWVLLGADSTQAVRASVDGASSLFQCPFPPVWAVHPQGGRGRSRVIFLVTDPPPPSLNQQVAESRFWCNSIRGAQKHFAGLDFLGPATLSESALSRAWGQYKSASKMLRTRKLRRPRRGAR